MVPYLRAANVKDGYLDLVDVKKMNFTPSEQVTFALRSGDVLVSEGSGSLGSVGASTVWYGDLPDTICFQNTLLRLRPRPGIDGRYLGWWARSAFSSGIFASIATGANIYHLSAERIRALRIRVPPLEEQRYIADFLNIETKRIDVLISGQLRVLELLDERINSRIREVVGNSGLADNSGGETVPLRRLITRINRATMPTDEVVTAFRDGQVTSRGIRRSEGYTLSADSDPQGQGVEFGDIVVHGLDGFAGAIGDAEKSGNCSPVYHVCLPVDGGNSAFYGRMLRVLAVTGYLGLFATSTRERAVDFRNWGLFGSIPIPRLAPSIQHDIGRQIVQTRPLRAEVYGFNRLLAERRQALITAAVTGQIDVTTARGLVPSGGVTA